MTMTMMQDKQPDQNRDRMPVVFVGHGSPMNAIEDNRWSRGFTSLASKIPRPRAILAISAHWYIDGTFVTANVDPITIHDFGGFPDALYQVQYPAKGSPKIAEQVTRLIDEKRVGLSMDWGLDHGTWSVLRWMYPEADLPVVQLSIDRNLSQAQHLTLAEYLRPLRNQGILIFASGNIVHNLRDAFGQYRAGTELTPDWASRFDDSVLNAAENYQTGTIMSLLDTNDGQIAHPTPDHWLPFIYAYGAADPGEPVSSPIEGFDMGSISMRSIIFGSH